VTALELAALGLLIGSGDRLACLPERIEQRKWPGRWPTVARRSHKLLELLQGRAVAAMTRVISSGQSGRAMASGLQQA